MRLDPLTNLLAYGGIAALCTLSNLRALVATFSLNLDPSV